VTARPCPFLTSLTANYHTQQASSGRSRNSPGDGRGFQSNDVHRDRHLLRTNVAVILRRRPNSPPQVRILADHLCETPRVTAVPRQWVLGVAPGCSSLPDTPAAVAEVPLDTGSRRADAAHRPAIAPLRGPVIVPSARDLAVPLYVEDHERGDSRSLTSAMDHPVPPVRSRLLRSCRSVWAAAVVEASAARSRCA
jgi:hypothetical protein